jgi:hypothetical protein
LFVPTKCCTSYWLFIYIAQSIVVKFKLKKLYKNRSGLNKASELKLWCFVIVVINTETKFFQSVFQIKQLSFIVSKVFWRGHKGEEGMAILKNVLIQMEVLYIMCIIEWSFIFGAVFRSPLILSTTPTIAIICNNNTTTTKSSCSKQI